MNALARILIVDDEETIRTALQAALQPEGYEIHLAASGEQALTILNQAAVDLLICDIFMPYMDGIEVLTELRRRRLAVPVLAMTEPLHAPYLQIATKLGARDGFVKPVERRMLLHLVHRALGNAHAG